MKNISILAFFFFLFMTSSCEKEFNQEFDDLTISDSTEESLSQRATIRFERGGQERVVVANRVSGSITVIDAKENTIINTYEMPDNGEPMYVVHIPVVGSVFVGDRANDRVVVFDEKSFAIKGTVPAGKGVFHMWASRNGRQLWVNNDIDNTTTIINPRSMSVVGTAETPADLVALGGKPHDVFVGPFMKTAFVSVTKVKGDNDYVVKYDARTFEEIGRAPVGKDPHLSATFKNHLLYVPCQNSNGVYLIDRRTMQQVDIIPFNGAHGAIMSKNGSYFYTADIGGSKLGTINTATNSVSGMPVTTPHPTAHNLAINREGNKLFVTHSGTTADQVSIYDLSPTPSYNKTLTVGKNPFGLAYYKIQGLRIY